ncbi:hypothetical protein [Commensalibacter melissae]|uniref:hypothetical protein n=1 Tax=Commensalibacter melissae TaxID=2070537 RepID=UPI0012D9330B|nr:hypothetical protein [Commensalibacter melissae]MUH04046.1 hypothetical protein [Commensalibacter melissae]
MIKLFFNEYNLKARCIPVVIACFPILALLTSFLDLNKFLIANSIVISIFTIVIMFLLSLYTRSKGRQLEKDLVKDWGGLPTTRFLRHRDKTIDKIEKQKIYQKIEDNLTDKIPTEDEEKSNPEEADKQYNIIVNTLRMKTRDEEYCILLYENILYGFFRNSLALKKISLFISISIIIGLLIILCQNNPYHFYDFKNFVSYVFTVKLSLILKFILTIMIFFYWVFVVTKKNVKKYADRYALALINTVYQIW